MSRVLTVASQKGGVGKTTTVLNLGFILSRLGDRVLVVDADPQGGMAVASNLRKKTTTGLVQMLRGELSAEQVIIPTRVGQMAVVGAGVQEPEDITELEDGARDGRLKAAIEELKQGFGYTLIDAPAGVGGVVSSLLSSSDGVILVLRCRTLVLKTLPVFLKLLRHVRENLNPELSLEGALLTMRDPSNELEAELLMELESLLPEALLFAPEIPHDERFERANIRSLPVALLADGREPARPYLELALELKERDLMRRVGGEADEHAEGLF